MASSAESGSSSSSTRGRRASARANAGSVVFTVMNSTAAAPLERRAGPGVGG
ncbi:hypothetical protein [Streptomyces rubiginosohelvolus]|uniref:hypothetical protein n=1 Tax=Streptomyces rubiginosohelvolus TaxID=67362 RepID=UPI003698FB05